MFLYNTCNQLRVIVAMVNCVNRMICTHLQEKNRSSYFIYITGSNNVHDCGAMRRASLL